MHPLEVAQILSAMTSDEDVITAGMMAELARTIHAVTVSEADGFPYATERLKPYIEGGIGRVDGVLAGRCMALVNEISASGTLLHGKCVPAEG